MSPAPAWVEGAGSYLRECHRVLKVTKKPNSEEFKTIVKVSAAGMLLIGLVGFLIQIALMIFV